MCRSVSVLDVLGGVLGVQLDRPVQKNYSLGGPRLRCRDVNPLDSLFQSAAWCGRGGYHS